MKLSYQNRDEAIYALATPLAESAIAVIRTSGGRVIELVSSCFSKPGALLRAEGHTTVVGSLRDPEDGSHVDQVVCIVYRSPRSYTGDDAVELSCHGSVATIKACLNVLERCGFRRAEPGEFTFRAFLAGKMGLTQAEAVNEIVRAQTDTARRLALGRLEGKLERRVEEIKQSLVRVLGSVQIQLDYPEEDTGEIGFQTDRLNGAIEQLEELVNSYRAGRLYQGGVKVALAGATNAGKSSLFNRMLTEERSIVSETHGTTRDFIEARLDIAGIPVLLYDTAGIREITEAVEREGMRRTREVMEQSSVVIYLVDATVGITESDRDALDSLAANGSLLPVWNKIDRVPADSRNEAPEGFVPISVERGEGFAALRTELHAMLTEGGGASLTGSETVIDNARQAQLVQRAIEAGRRCVQSMAGGMPADIVAVDLQEAVDALGEITGEVSSDDVLDAMFSDFCVGK